MSDKISLCIDARMAFSSGIGRFIRNVVPIFLTPPFSPTLLVDKLGNKWCEDFPQIECKTPIYSFSEQVQLLRKIPSCDLFWAPHYNVPCLPIRAKKKIVTIHDACHLALEGFSLMQRLYAKTVMSCAFHRFDAVTTDSEFSKKELVKFLGKREVKVFPIGVNRELFHGKYPEDQVNALKKKYRLSEKVILYVGNCKPHKNLEGLIKGFKIACQEGLQGYSLVILGKLFGGVLQNAANVCYLGEVSDEELALFYQLATLFIFPSFYEGFGLPPLEAMSSGCLVLASSFASIPEVCGEAALYVDVTNPCEIARGIRQLLEDTALQKELLERGVKRALHYRWEKTREQYHQFFQEVLYA